MIMALKRVGCTSLSRCGLIIGWVIGVIALFCLVVTMAFLYGYVEDLLRANINLIKETKRHHGNETAYSYEIYRVNRLRDEVSESSILSVVLLMILITSILLIIGVNKRRQYFVLSWVISMIIFFIYVLIKLPLVFGDGIFVVFPTALIAYLWYIIFSIYVKFVDSKHHIDIDMNNFQENVDGKNIVDTESPPAYN